MKNVLIVYTSRWGQTRKISEKMAELFRDRGVATAVVDLASVPSVALEKFDGVIVGTPVYMARTNRRLRHWVKSHRNQLEKKITGLMIVCNNAADKRAVARAPERKILGDFIVKTEWTPMFAAAFAGALNFTEYNPVLRRIMLRISKTAGGPTDPSRDYELTDWKDVTDFVQSVVDKDVQSPYAVGENVSRERELDRLMPVYDHRMRVEKTVKAPFDLVYRAILETDPRDMRLANALAWVRTLGKPGDESAATFLEASEKFGMVPLADIKNHEVVGGLIGQFWKLDFGIHFCRNQKEFMEFDAPGFVKVVNNFRVQPIQGGRTLLSAEMRAHGTSASAAYKFNFYWFLLHAGIKLYMKSGLAAIRRKALKMQRASMGGFREELPTFW